jgi:hypothetical protein
MNSYNTNDIFIYDSKDLSFAKAHIGTVNTTFKGSVGEFTKAQMGAAPRGWLLTRPGTNLDSNHNIDPQTLFGDKDLKEKFKEIEEKEGDKKKTNLNPDIKKSNFELTAEIFGDFTEFLYIHSARDISQLPREQIRVLREIVYEAKSTNPTGYFTEFRNYTLTEILNSKSEI